MVQHASGAQQKDAVEQSQAADGIAANAVVATISSMLREVRQPTGATFNAVIDPYLSTSLVLRITRSPATCSSVWVDAPVALFSDVEKIGEEVACERLHLLVRLTLREELTSLRPLLTPRPEPADSTDGAPVELFNLELYTDINLVRRDTTANVIWQWDNNPSSMLDMLYEYIVEGRPGQALRALKKGQTHNRRAQALYDVAVQRLHDFWEIAMFASWDAPDFAVVERGVKWQYDNDNIPQLHQADQQAKRGDFNRAYFTIILQQRHSVRVMAVYRACWIADRSRFLKILSDKLGT